MTTPEPATIGTLFATRAREIPDRELLVFHDERITYAEADRRSRVLARRLLADGVGKGNRVALCFANTPDFVVAFAAITRIGAIAIPVNTFSKPRELAHLLRHSDARLLITTPELLGNRYLERMEEAAPELASAGTPRPLLLASLPQLRGVWVIGAHDRAWADDGERVHDDLLGRAGDALLDEAEAEVTPADLAVIVYTSGSTAAPKGVLHTHGTLVRHAFHLSQRIDLRADDRVYSTMPFFWVGGLAVGLLSAIQAGATLLGQTRIDGDTTLAFLAREHVTVVSGWPEAFAALAELPTFADHDLSAVRRGTLYAALPPEKRPTDPLLRHNSLGMTESCGPHTYADVVDVDLPEHLRGAFGTPMPGIEHRISDPDTSAEMPAGEVGEIWLRGPNLTPGLVKVERADTFTPDGWYRTGDMGSMRDGCLFFAGRRGDMIKSHGANVSPREVEAVLVTLPGVRHAYVVGLPGSYGEEIAAAVVPAAGATLDPAALLDAARAELSAYKVPRVIEVFADDEIPMLAAGKLNRAALIDALHARTTEA